MNTEYRINTSPASVKLSYLLLPNHFSLLLWVGMEKALTNQTRMRSEHGSGDKMVGGPFYLIFHLNLRNIYNLQFTKNFAIFVIYIILHLQIMFGGTRRKARC